MVAILKEVEKIPYPDPFRQKIRVEVRNKLIEDLKNQKDYVDNMEIMEILAYEVEQGLFGGKLLSGKLLPNRWYLRDRSRREGKSQIDRFRELVEKINGHILCPRCFHPLFFGLTDKGEIFMCTKNDPFDDNSCFYENGYLKYYCY